jgi:large subunit ribosomal protein L6
MSRIGKLPIALPKGVTIELSEGEVSAKGPKGSLSCTLPPLVSVSQADNVLSVSAVEGEQNARAMHGLARTLLANLVTGVSTGFSKTLEINGTGYSVENKGNYLVFNLGYSHPIYYELPEGVEGIIPPKVKTKITVTGIDKQAVGSAAAKIRSFRPPEPYKGKGVKYSDEVIRRKEGKSGGR